MYIHNNYDADLINVNDLENSGSTWQTVQYNVVCNGHWMETDWKGILVLVIVFANYIYRADTQSLVAIQNAHQCCGIHLFKLGLLQEFHGFVFILFIVEQMSR